MASPHPSPRPHHAVLIPQPAQGHVTPMLQLAKLLHSKGFHITFVNSEYNHRRFLRSRGPRSLDGVDGFQFEAIPDGLPPSQDEDVTQDIAELCISTTKNCVAPFRDLLMKLVDGSGSSPKVTCVIADGVMTFAQRVAEELGILALVFWTTSACGFMGYLQFSELVKRGYTPLKDESYLSNGYLDTPIDWIPGMKKIRLKDIPSFIRTTDPNDIMLNFDGGEAQNCLKSHGLILNTFDELEADAVAALKQMHPRVYTVGPLLKSVDSTPATTTHSIGSNLWREDTDCIKWLDSQEPASVVYVNFGSITIMTAEQLGEFAWGLASSKHPFLWVVRPDILAAAAGDHEATATATTPAVVPEGFVIETKDRGVLASWCPQEQVLSHPAVGVFLTHCGWNSTLESICSGVPMICWPFFAEQPTNCRYICAEWGIGMEIGSAVKREEVEGLVREIMMGGDQKGKEMRVRAREWKERAERAVEGGGSSCTNMEMLVQDLYKGIE